MPSLYKPCIYSERNWKYSQQYFRWNLILAGMPMVSFAENRSEKVGGIFPFCGTRTLATIGESRLHRVHSRRTNSTEKETSNWI